VRTTADENPCLRKRKKKKRKCKQAAAGCPAKFIKPRANHGHTKGECRIKGGVHWGRERGTRWDPLISR